MDKKNLAIGGLGLAAVAGWAVSGMLAWRVSRQQKLMNEVAEDTKRLIQCVITNTSGWSEEQKTGFRSMGFEVE